MTNYKEIVTKAVVSKGKRLFTSEHSIEVNNPSTVLGCWVINHNFNGNRNGNDIIIDGSYDVNIWYSTDNDTKTEVIKDTNNYHEVIHMREVNDIDGEEIIVRSLKQPNCINIEIDNNIIKYTIEKELGIELVGDIKVKIEANELEEEWDDIIDESSENNGIDNVEENFMEDVI